MVKLISIKSISSHFNQAETPVKQSILYKQSIWLLWGFFLCFIVNWVWILLFPLNPRCLRTYSWPLWHVLIPERLIDRCIKWLSHPGRAEQGKLEASIRMQRCRPLTSVLTLPLGRARDVRHVQTLDIRVWTLRCFYLHNVTFFLSLKPELSN